MGSVACNPGSPTADFFIATDGNDAWSGTLAAPNVDHSDGPFASLARAQTAVRGLGSPARTVTVLVRGGTYYLAQSATAPGTLASERPTRGAHRRRRSCGKRIRASSHCQRWRTARAAGLDEPRGQRVEDRAADDDQPFESLYYNGERRMRARSSTSNGVGYYLSNGTCYLTPTQDDANAHAVDLETCRLGAFLRVAAEVPPTGANQYCPTMIDEKDASHVKCMDRFQYYLADPVVAWTNLAAAPTGVPSAQSPTPCQANGSPFPAGDIEVTLFAAWTVDIMRVACVDTSAHIIYFTGAMHGAGETGSINYSGPVVGHRYVVDNALDDFMTEAHAGISAVWFVDRSAMPWTLYYAVGPGESLATDSVVIRSSAVHILSSPVASRCRTTSAAVSSSPRGSRTRRSTA